MLKRLTVKNFALIENAMLEFNQGFTVITGETGSGKSILLGALGMILGERADFSVIRDKDNKTIVEAWFDLSKMSLHDFFKEHDLDYAEETIIRREIHAQGKSRAFINDTPVQLTLLKDFTGQLIHIHSQHHTINLRNKNFQLELIDTWAGLTPLRYEFQALYEGFLTVQKKVEQLNEELINQRKQEDFNRFQLEELEELELERVNYEELDVLLKRIEQLEDIKSSFELIQSVVHDDNGINTLLLQVKKNIVHSDPKVAKLFERIEAVRIELDDIAADAADELISLETDPLDVEINIQRLDKFNTLLNKHHLTNQEELKKLAEDLSVQLTDVAELEDQLNRLKTGLVEQQKELETKAQELSQQRKKHAVELVQEMITLLVNLRLPDTQLKFEFQPKKIGGSGIDEVELCFSPNKGMDMKPVQKAASGGELSRLMLAIQYVLSTRMQLPTVIFDEIDTGVSGGVAEKIGIHLQRMGSFMQLLAITHLPQVAAKGEHHWKVSKTNLDSSTVTYFEKLSADERVDEIAKLMSGAKVNEAALENAKNLMNS